MIFKIIKILLILMISISSGGFLLMYIMSKEYRQEFHKEFKTFDDYLAIIAIVCIPFVNISCLSSDIKDFKKLKQEAKKRIEKEKMQEEKEKRQQIKDFLYLITTLHYYFGDENVFNVYNSIYEKIILLRNQGYHENIINGLEDSLYESIKYNSHNDKFLNTPSFLKSLINLNSTLDSIMKKIEDSIKDEMNKKIISLEEYNQKSIKMYESIMESIEKNQSPL